MASCVGCVRMNKLTTDWAVLREKSQRFGVDSVDSTRTLLASSQRDARRECRPFILLSSRARDSPRLGSRALSGR